MIDLDQQRQAYVYKLRENYGLTWEKIGTTIGASRKKARRLYDLHLLGSLETDKVSSVISIERFRPLRIEGDAVVCCDWHVPLHSPYLVNKLFEIASQRDIKQLVIVGDLFHMEEFSHFLPHQPEASFELEKEEGTKLMSAALEVFDTISLSWGNHDFRMVKFLNFKFSYEACIRYVLEDLTEDEHKRLDVTDLDYLFYNPGPYEIRLCHQKNYSKIPLAVALDLAKRYEMSVLTAHSHHFAQGVTFSGKHRIFEGGGLFDAHRTEYVQRTTNNHTWVQGFYIFKDGICYPYSPLYNNL